MNHSKTWLDLVWNKVRKNYHGHSSARLLRSTVAELANTQSAQSSFPISRRLPPTGSLFSLPFFRAGIVQHPLLPIHFPGRETDRTHETGTNAIPAISCIPAMYYQYGSLCFCSPNALWHPPQAPYIPAAHLLKFAWNTESERTSGVSEQYLRGWERCLPSLLVGRGNYWPEGTDWRAEKAP